MPPKRTAAPSPFWPTQERVPDIFNKTQQTTPTIASTNAQLQSGVPSGQFALGAYIPRENVITMGQGQAPTSVSGMHETGHAIWHNDLTPEQQQQWAALHKTESQRPGIPFQAVARYTNDPAHSFAHAYGMYAADPIQMQRQSPEAYNLIRHMSGFEYKRK